MSEEKLTLLDRLMGSAKKKTENNKTHLEAQVKEKLKGIVYDDELVNELTPVFMNFYGNEGFDQILELLETKEKQIEAISGGDWFKQETDSQFKKEPEEDEDEKSSDALSSVDEILSKKYATKE